MATIRKRPNGTTELRYVDAHGDRRSLYLPQKTTKLLAETVAAKVDHIINRKVTGSEPDRAVAQWLADLPDTLYSKLTKAGLAPPRTPAEPDPEPEPEPQLPTVQQWTTDYIAKHAGKDQTLTLLEVTARSLVKFFGTERTIDSITAGDAEDYRSWLEKNGNERQKYRTGLSKNTVRRTVGRSKQFFQSAVKHELLTRNPFAGEASAVGGNDERLFLVPAEWIERCIRVAPCEDWRIILAFARYAGMRSHECRIQRWDDIDLVNRRMLVRSNKTPPVRSCPIFPELMPHLLRAREMAEPGAEFLQTRYSPDANLLTTLAKIVTKAGLVAWPKLMQNLRATRETELMANFPTKDVTSWLGNSPAVAHKHYAMVTQASFDRATTEGAKLAGVTAGVPAEKVPLKVPPTSSDMAGNVTLKKKPITDNPGNYWDCLQSAVADLMFSSPGRTSPTAENTGYSESSENSTPESTPQGPAALFAECIRQHLPQDQMQMLIDELTGSRHSVASARQHVSTAQDTGTPGVGRFCQTTVN
jgi:integrase